ncbi:MAG: ABC transporter permease subunit, partial [Panacagrimonas sp.]
MSGYTSNPRIRWTEWLPWLAALAFFFALPEYLSLGARILIYILFALSLDLILGYAGIITLGHSAFFGLGAYTAGALGAHTGVTDPLLQLAAAATLSALLGAATGAVILRTRALTLLMLTLAIT